jgi:group I intron endonuclease
MKYTVYKVTNKINNKFYVGVHSTKNPNDSYMGSGKIIKDAILKYGKENFVKEVLFIFDSLEEALNKEKEIVNENFVKDNNNYNLSLGGGIGGKNINGLSFAGHRHDEKTKEKIRKASLGNSHNVGKKLTEEHKKKIGAKNAVSLKGKTKSEEHKQKIRESILKKNAGG